MTDIKLIFLLAFCCLATLILTDSTANAQTPDVCMGGPCLPSIRYDPSGPTLENSAEKTEKKADDWEQRLDAISQGADNACAKAARQEATDAANCLAAEAASIQLMIWGLNEVEKRIHDLIKNYDPNALAAYEACAAKRDAGMESFIGAVEAITGLDLTTSKPPEEKLAENLEGKFKSKIIEKIFGKIISEGTGGFTKGLKLGDNIPAVKKAEIGLDCADSSMQKELDALNDARSDRNVTEQHLQEAIDRYNICNAQLEAAIQQYQLMQSDEACIEGVPGQSESKPTS